MPPSSNPSPAPSSTTSASCSTARPVSTTPSPPSITPSASTPISPSRITTGGRALAAAGRLEDAIAAFTRHLELEPDYSCAVYDLARALSEHGKHDPVLERFKEYAALEPEDPQGHCSLGVELMLTGCA